MQVILIIEGIILLNLGKNLILSWIFIGLGIIFLIIQLHLMIIYLEDREGGWILFQFIQFLLLIPIFIIFEIISGIIILL